MKTNKNYAYLLVFEVLILIGVLVFPLDSFRVNRYPVAARDSDSTPTGLLIANLGDSSMEPVILKFAPFGYLTVENWNKDLTSLGGEVKSAQLIVNWRTDIGRGAGNIYIGYSLDGGKTFKEVGPFTESTGTATSIDLPQLSLSDLNGVDARFRGEDMDGKGPAVAYVNMRMDVDMSSPFLKNVALVFVALALAVTLLVNYGYVSLGKFFGK